MISKSLKIIHFIWAGFTSLVMAQQVEFTGQLIGWGNVFDRNGSILQAGMRYLPSLTANFPLTENSAFDVEITGNGLASLTRMLDRDSENENQLKLYRYWVRYATGQFEVRLGNQKINFGKAKLIRPLMWFDQLDPRDPIQFTEGVKALLVRYYFLNNANLWFWALYGNQALKGLEFLPTQKNKPEIGGRFQYPVHTGEIALSYHQRQVNPDVMMQNSFLSLSTEPFTERRLALDAQLDLELGLWTEAVLINYETDVFLNHWQKMITFGTDYTLPVGNGLYVMAEHFLQWLTEEWSALDPSVKFTGLSLNYPVTLLDQLFLISFYNWQEHDFYHYLNWQRTYDNITFNLSLFIMPVTANLFGSRGFANVGGNGFQVMLIYNH